MNGTNTPVKGGMRADPRFNNDGTQEDGAQEDDAREEAGHETANYNMFTKDADNNTSERDDTRAGPIVIDDDASVNDDPKPGMMQMKGSHQNEDLNQKMKTLIIKQKRKRKRMIIMRTNQRMILMIRPTIVIKQKRRIYRVIY